MDIVRQALAWARRRDPFEGTGVSGVRPAVVVTGASSGIGLEIARIFYDAGNHVVLIARDAEALTAARNGLAASTAAGQGQTYPLPLDITQPDASARLEAFLGSRQLYVETLVNCAGMGLAGPFETHSDAEIGQLIALNVTALTALTRAVLPAMKGRGAGGILNIASLGGYVPGPYQAAYYASKAYVCSLSEALNSELAGSGVHVTVAAPGPVETGFHAAMGSEHAFYRTLLPALSARRAARSAVLGYAIRRSVVVPGLLNKLMAVALSVTPHMITVPIMRALLARR